MLVQLRGVTGKEILDALYNRYARPRYPKEGDDKVEILWKFSYETYDNYGNVWNIAVVIRNYKNGPRYTGDDSVDLMKIDAWSVEFDTCSSLQTAALLLNHILARTDLMVTDTLPAWKSFVMTTECYARLCRKRLEEITEEIDHAEARIEMLKMQRNNIQESLDEEDSNPFAKWMHVT